MHRRRKIGAEVVPGGVHFCVWAPGRERVAVVIDDRDVPLARESGGYFAALVPDARAGTRYRFRLDDDREAFPDPASRYQPEGPHGPSEVVDPAFAWGDGDWRGVTMRGRVLYELHIGTFTREGTYAAAAQHLEELREIGINTIELMPVNEFAGAFGWGYDGVDLWSPMHRCGTPDDLRRFVDTAHSHGLAVILDVVYNHLGPDGCYLTKFTPHYFTSKYENEWGDAVNFDGDDSDGVREFFAENAAYWMDEYHFDGLRIDATQSMHDSSETHVLREITERARAAAGQRSIILIAENEPQETKIVDDYGLDAMWNDDWHHSTRVALTGLNDAYYTDYRGAPQEFVSMAKLGFLYQGQRYKWQKKRRGTPSRHLPPERLVCYLENHDQVANSARGERLLHLTSPGRFRAMTTLLLLQPQTPMLFQGQESGAPQPFLYFADHKPELAKLVRKGRHDFLAQFPAIATMRNELAPPEARETFERCQLDRTTRDEAIVRLHRDLLRLRGREPFVQQRSDWLHGSVIADECFALRWFTNGEDDRLLLINLGRALHFDPAPDPLLAPPAGFTRWQIVWSSEAPEYGGSGMAEADTEENWHIAGHAAVVLQPV